MDEPILSLSRLWGACRLWVYLMLQEPPVYVSLRRLLRFHRRPMSSERVY